jgi:hypothetical protein
MVAAAKALAMTASTCCEPQQLRRAKEEFAKG